MPRKKAEPPQEPEQSTAPASNVPESVLLQHVSKIMTAEKKQGQSNSALRNARKAAKADGINLTALDTVRSLIKRDIHENIEEFNSVVHYARMLNAPIYSQLELFDAPEVDEDAVVDRASGEGLRAGKLGESEAACPYDATSAAGQAWLFAYRDGQKILMAAFSEASGMSGRA